MPERRQLRVRDMVGQPEFLALLFGIVAYFVDLHLSVLSFLYGYLGFVLGTSSTLITPYSLIMSGTIFSVICTVLFLAQVRWWRCFLIGTFTALASLVLFEFVWDLLFLLRSWPITSWFGFPLPVSSYIMAFLSLILLYFVGIMYWKRSYLVIGLWISTLTVFIIWYDIGYPQVSATFALTPAYILNASAKVLMSLAMMSPVVAWGYGRMLELNLAKPVKLRLRL
ncbi:MAG: hypothetical protein M1327_00945 [Candidatus Thermoplasmatota archaeon]|nr:hypothetical protein [Candidatus Thermoplasmatota archaeon]